jgi:hypothetical protein
MNMLPSRSAAVGAAGAGEAGAGEAGGTGLAADPELQAATTTTAASERARIGRDRI